MAVVASRPAARMDFMAAMISWIFSGMGLCEMFIFAGFSYARKFL